jgi:serine/threonine protein kinase
MRSKLARIGFKLTSDAPVRPALQIAFCSCELSLFSDFTERCLSYDTLKRLTAEAALQHSFILQSIDTEANSTSICIQPQQSNDQSPPIPRIKRVDYSRFNIRFPPKVANNQKWIQRVFGKSLPNKKLARES